jgi:hypothetical protein
MRKEEDTLLRFKNTIATNDMHPSIPLLPRRPSSKDRATNTYVRRTLLDRFLEISTHAHTQL